GDVLLVGLTDAAALGGRIEAAPLAAAQLSVAVPHVADGDGLDRLAGFLHFEDDVDVLLAAAADAEEADAEALVGAQAARGAGSGERQRGGAGGAGLEEIAAMHL